MRDDLGRSNQHLRGRYFCWLLTPGAARSAILADEAPEPAAPRQRSYRRRKNSERS